MDVRPLLIELLISGFFAIACLKARGDNFDQKIRSPRDFFRLLPRLERLRRTRWQWFSMVLILFIVRRQLGVPMVVEFTALAQFLIFLMLPVAAETAQHIGLRPGAGRTAGTSVRARVAVR